MHSINSRLVNLSSEIREGVVSLPDLIDKTEIQFERKEGEVLAFVPEPNRFARLRRDAALLADRYAEEMKPPLFGVPVGFKDIIHVDGFTTRAGSRLPSSELQGPQGPVASALREAGCLVLGKTVSTEFAYFAPGPTRNPLALDHTPGGSSSGSAAAVAAGLCPLTLGTQTIGSIARPASYCGVVGYKPSYDRTSREGVIPLSPSLDHVGFFSGDVSSARLVAEVTCCDWEDRPASSRPRLGVPSGPYLERASPRALAELEAQCEKLRASGFTVNSVDAFGDIDEIEIRHRLLVAREAAAVHIRWYQDGAPRGLDSTGDPVMNLPWTHCGFPTIALPGIKDGAQMPIGLQIAGRWFEDESLLNWAEQIEEVISA